MYAITYGIETSSCYVTRDQQTATRFYEIAKQFAKRTHLSLEVTTLLVDFWARTKYRDPVRKHEEERDVISIIPKTAPVVRLITPIESFRRRAFLFEVNLLAPAREAK